MSSNGLVNLSDPSVNEYVLNNFFINARTTATLYLLKSSLLVSISGAFRIYIAFLLIQAECVALHCIAGALIIYAVYTLDRAMDTEEDTVNRTELKGASAKFALFVALICFIIGAFVLATDNLLTIAFLPLVTGYLYTKGLIFGKFRLRLKGSMGVKNTVVGLTWGAFIAGIAGSSAENMLPTLLVFLFFGTKLFVNSAVYDFKDVKGDFMAGIRTLPVSLGEKNTRKLLLFMHLVSHSTLMFFLLNGTVGHEPVILFYSLLAGIVTIRNFTRPVDIENKSRQTRRLFLVDGESSSAIGLKTVTGLII
ncbi:UbiA family prenyltransferase [Methanolobus halotolerans]|uniref:Prenyltransferase n=1 Tax=Methanolobus halotolerans TaxID=2052935 RepID=A0A4E0Q4Q6_9EURY|nr:UbiA family prenyltransferase [Methanolobus halotolerans]TGC08965.1 prenyltransferase [Methanolobus halotolerans]